MARGGPQRRQRERGPEAVPAASLHRPPPTDSPSVPDPVLMGLLREGRVAVGGSLPPRPPSPADSPAPPTHCSVQVHPQGPQEATEAEGTVAGLPVYTLVTLVEPGTYFRTTMLMRPTKAVAWQWVGMAPPDGGVVPRGYITGLATELLRSVSVQSP